MNLMTSMSAMELGIMAVVLVAAMVAWLSMVYLADREPRHRRPSRPAGGTPAGGPAEVPGKETAAVPSPRRPGDETGPGLTPGERGGDETGPGPAPEHAGEDEAGRVPHAVGPAAR